MSNKRTHQPVSPEDQFLERLGDVAPIAQDTEQAHLAAALTAVRQGGTAPVTAGRPTQRSAPLWRKPRMALSKLAAIVAGLSIPMKAAAASTVAVAAIGGGVAVTSAPENPPTDTPAAEALLEAEDRTGFPLPARGEPSRDEEVDATVETDEVEAQDEHGIDGPTQADAAKAKEDGRTFGEETSATASDGKSTEARERAAEAAAERRRDADAADAAAERRRDAEARQDGQARAEAGRQQDTDDAAATSDDTEDDLSDDVEDDTDDAEDAAGADAGGAGRAKADAARGR